MTVSSFVDEFADIIALLTSECSDNITVCNNTVQGQTTHRWRWNWKHSV